jgi:hypothetical protein
MQVFSKLKLRKKPKALSAVPNGATSRMIAVFSVSSFALVPNSPPGQITPPFSVGRRKPGWWAGSVLMAINLISGPK